MGTDLPKYFHDVCSGKVSASNRSNDPLIMKQL